MQSFMQTVRRLGAAPLTTVGVVLVLGGAVLLLGHGPNSYATSGVAIGIIHGTPTPKLPKGALPGDVVTATVAPTDTPIPSPTPLPAPTATATVAPQSVLAISPTQESVPCDNKHYQLIAITNTGNVGIEWTTQATAGAWGTNPRDSQESSNSILAPGLSQTTMPEGYGTPGQIWTIQFWQASIGGSLGPQATTVTILCI